MLEFHEHLVGELLQEDGLVVMGAGLGLAKVLAALVRLHTAKDGILFLLSMSDSQRQAFREELQELNLGAELPIDISNEYTSTERSNFYSEGGTFVITSRILVVDMLNERVPLKRVAGLVICNAHRITETCTEAFIVRLFKAANKDGFVRALTDQSQGMILGFLKMERVLKSLFIKKISLWPRFHMSVASVLEKNPPEVVDIRVPLTSNMIGIQNAIIEVMDACLKEMRKTNKVDIEDLTVENGLFKSFDEIIRRQLDPIWHTIGRKTKQLVADLKTLRKLADYLVRYDAVTFLKYLDNLKASESARSIWIFAGPSHKIFELAKRRVYQMVLDNGMKVIPPDARVTKGIRTAGISLSVGPYAGKKRKWNSKESDIIKSAEASARTAFNHSESKVPDDNSNPSKDQGVELEMILEEMPKWKVLKELLEEIHEEREKKSLAEETSNFEDAWQGSRAILVACKDERTCLQLQDLIGKGAKQLMLAEWNKYLLGKTQLNGMKTRDRKKKQSKGYGREAKNAADVDGATNTQKMEQIALSAAAAAAQKEVIEVEADQPKGRRKRAGVKKGTKGKITESNTAGNNKKTKGNQGKKRFTEGESENTEGYGSGNASNKPDEKGFNLQNNEGKHIMHDEEPGKPIPEVYFFALEGQQRILEVIRPSFVVVYDPDMAFVREMEVFKAENENHSLKVYFLFHEDSTEARKFESSISRENQAFESLIRQKSSMMISIDQAIDTQPLYQSATGLDLHSSTRKAGGRKASEKQMQVVVDMREFASSLPCVLHQQGIRIMPVTLEVGDYILSPDICVERKSIADLYSSFASGRLYHQAETMTRYYRIPVLLIEFSQDKSFSLQSANDIGDDILPANIVSKMSLLVLHFPRLRIVWSRSLHATADIFMSLKANQDEPDVDKAMRVGVPTEDGLIEGDTRADNYNTTAVELLRRLPGVTDANYRSLMDGCKSLSELAVMTVEQLAELMGGQRPARILRDFLDAKCPSLT